jgi:hypothetical protein
MAIDRRVITQNPNAILVELIYRRVSYWAGATMAPPRESCPPWFVEVSREDPEELGSGVIMYYDRCSTAEAARPRRS